MRRTTYVGWAASLAIAVTACKDRGDGRGTAGSAATEVATVKPMCLPLEILADGMPAPGLVAGDAQAQVVTGDPPVAYHEVVVSPRARRCGPAMLIETWEADEPRVAIAFGGRSMIVVAQQETPAEIRVETA